MPYFVNFLKEKAASHLIIELDVHCDVLVFEWLMDYITHQKVNLECRSVVSILVSSNFLQMEPLVDKCLGYISKNLNEILALPIDMRCIQQPLVEKLALLMTPDALGTLDDKEDKLLGYQG